jgi:hypothetical protein
MCKNNRVPCLWLTEISIASSCSSRVFVHVVCGLHQIIGAYSSEQVQESSDKVQKSSEQVEKGSDKVEKRLRQDTEKLRAGTNHHFYLLRPKSTLSSTYSKNSCCTSSKLSKLDMKHD